MLLLEQESHYRW